MRFLKQISILLAVLFLVSLCGCAMPEQEMVSSADSSAESAAEPTQDEGKKLPKITSSDKNMSQFFDISLFDEENYASIYLGEDFNIDAVYDGVKLPVPTTISELSANGWKLQSGSDYNEKSLIYANETVELNFENKNSAVITALFYNSSNTSVRLNECNIVKFHINNGYVKNDTNYAKFNINGITNTSVVTDIVHVLGTPSHFYKKTETTYYFDYFIMESDRRNKIRIYIDLVDDAVTAVEFANYR